MICSIKNIIIILINFIFKELINKLIKTLIKKLNNK